MSKREISHQIYNISTSDNVIPSKAERKAAIGSRKWLLTIIRHEIGKDGKIKLISDSDDAAFSKHGSIYHRLTIAGGDNDIDVYVILNGKGLKWNNKELQGKSDQPLSNLPPAKDVAKWMYCMTKNALSYNDGAAAETVYEGKRGAQISLLGGRHYDIIPAFAYKDDNGRWCHIIPAEDDWESNPTTVDMKMVIDLDERCCRDPANKVLGYRDRVRLFKSVSKKLEWQKIYSISSFVIRLAVAIATKGCQSRFNQKNIASIIKILNDCIARGFFRDPHTKKKINLICKTKLITSNIVQYIQTLTCTSVDDQFE